MSGTRSNKRPPHIVFLVDTLPYLQHNILDESAIASLQALVVRILLYYADAVDDRITWGFRLFNSNSTSITMSNRCFYPISTHSIHEFIKELRSKLDQERTKAEAATISNQTTNNSKSNSSTDSCFSNLKETLMQTLTDFQWKDIDLLGSSPRPQRVRHSTRPGGGGYHRRHHPVTLNNYMYIISHRPHTLSDLHYYMEGHHKIQTRLTSQGDMLDAYEMIHKMADALKQWIWDGYATNQISINWIDKTGSRNLKEMDTFIRTGFDGIMQMFGGHVISEALFEYEYERFGLSFGTVFEHYRNKLMDPVPRLKLPKVRPQHGKKQAPPPDDDNNNIDKLDTLVWSGPLISRINTQDRFQIYAAPLERNKSSQPNDSIKSSTATLFDGMESMEIISLVSVTNIKLEWLATPGDNIYALWSSDGGFSNLINLLQNYHMVLIVKLCPSDESRSCQLALVESIIDGCGSLSLLSTQQEDEFITSTDYPLLLEYNANATVSYPAPLGSNIIDFLKVSTNPSVLHDLDKTAAVKGGPNVELLMDLPPCIGALIHESSSKFFPGGQNGSTADDTLTNETESVELSEEIPISAMPDTIDDFTHALHDLYLDSLYTTKYTLLESMNVLLSYVNHILNPENQTKTEISTVLASIQSMTMLSSEFDEKHRFKIPAMMKSDTTQGSKQELAFFSSWLSGVRANFGQNTEHEELSFKALKIKEYARLQKRAKLQMILILTAIQLIKKQKGNGKQERSTKRRKRKMDGLEFGQPTNLASENPEEQLEIYFDRMFIWEQVSNVINFLQEQDAEAAERSAKRLDPAAIYIHQFCSNLDKCFKKTLPSLIAKLWEKIDKDDDMDDFDETFPTPNKRRKTLLEMRMRGDSSGETMTADWITTPPRDSQESISSINTNRKHSQHLQQQQQQQPAPEISSSSSAASKRKQSMFPILPFMKREIIMSKVVNSKAKQQSVVEAENASKPKLGTNGRPTFRRAGSFTKSAMSPKRPVKRKPTTETTTVVMRKREQTSPTTPRTRMAREFGISLTPQAPKTAANSTSGSDDTDLLDNNISIINDLQSRFSSNMASAAKTPPRPRSTRSLGIAVSPARSAARKTIGHKSPRPHRTGSARGVLHCDHEHDSTGDAIPAPPTGPRDLTNDFLAAKSTISKGFRANSEVRKTFSSLFDD